MIIQWYKISNSYCEERLRLYGGREVRAEHCFASREMTIYEVSVEREITALFGGASSLTQLNPGFVTSP